MHSIAAICAVCRRARDIRKPWIISTCISLKHYVRTPLGQIVIYLSSTAATAPISGIYAPVICIHCSPTYGDGRGYWVFTFQSPGISLPCGEKLLITTLLFAPPYTTENTSRVSAPMLYPHTSPALRGQSKGNCPAHYTGYPMAIPVGGGRGYK